MVKPLPKASVVTGRWLMYEAEATPGTAAALARTSSKNRAQEAGSGY